MLSPKEVNRQIIASRVALADAKHSLQHGVHRPEVYRFIVKQMDILTTMLEESPEAMHWKINGIIDKFEALKSQAMN